MEIGAGVPEPSQSTARFGAPAVQRQENAVCGTVVAIPTFRRPDSLGRLLRAIARLATPVHVIVADNDPDRGDGIALVASLRDGGFPHTIEAIAVPDRGIAQVRNALVKQAIARPETAFIAMIDDDEWPSPDWLEGLLRVRAELGAHVVGGPVIRRFEHPVPHYLTEANNYGVGRYLSGPIELVDATSNVLFDASVFRETDGPWFDPAFALTGGEDKDFMLSLKLKGKVFAWADEAAIEEELPVSRCTEAWALKRAFSTGNSDMLINLKRRPPGFGPVSETVKVLGALGVAALNLSIFVANPAKRFEGKRLAARVGGKIAALMGHRHMEYRTIHGR